MGGAAADAGAFPAENIVALVQTNGGACMSAGEVLSLTTSDSISCSVAPTVGGFAVAIVAQSSGSSPASVTITGTFTPRGRDNNGVPNADATQIPNITMDVIDVAMHLRQTNCFAQYVNVVGGEPGPSLPSVADTMVDNNVGRIWASVFCDAPQNLDEGQKPGNSGCQTSATFAFPSCSTQ